MRNVIKTGLVFVFALGLFGCSSLCGDSYEPSYGGGCNSDHSGPGYK